MSEGILLINKPKGKTSFSLISVLRKILNVRKIGHAGTLDPMATGVMILLIGKSFTTLSNSFLSSNKEYLAEVTLGIQTDSFDADGAITHTSSYIPTDEDVARALNFFQGEIEQIPPMYSAKKVQGRKLYQYARQGMEIERPKALVTLRTTLLKYQYPKVEFHIGCSKGTYIRSIAQSLGEMLKCGAHLSGLVRTKSGTFSIEECLPGELLFNTPLDEARSHVTAHLRY